MNWGANDEIEWEISLPWRILASAVPILSFPCLNMDESSLTILCNEEMCNVSVYQRWITYHVFYSEWALVGQTRVRIQPNILTIHIRQDTLIDKGIEVCSEKLSRILFRNIGSSQTASFFNSIYFSPCSQIQYLQASPVQCSPADSSHVLFDTHLIALIIILALLTINLLNSLRSFKVGFVTKFIFFVFLQNVFYTSFAASAQWYPKACATTIYGIQRNIWRNTRNEYNY